MPKYLIFTIFSENIVKLKLEQNSKSLLYNHLVYIWAEKADF